MSSFVKISDLILSKISKNLKINDIWEISKINAEEWEILSEKISSLEDRDLNDLNNQLTKLL